MLSAKRRPFCPGEDELNEALLSLYDQTPPSLAVAHMITANSVRMIAVDPH